jgi:hypothetical protein
MVLRILLLNRLLLDWLGLLLDWLRLRLKWLDRLLLNGLLLDRLGLLNNNRLLLSRLGLLRLSLERLNGLLKGLLLLHRLRLRLHRWLLLLLLLSRVRCRPLLSIRHIRLNPGVSALGNNPISSRNLLGWLTLRRPIPRSSGVRVNISLLWWNSLLLRRDTLRSAQTRCRSRVRVPVWAMAIRSGLSGNGTTVSVGLLRWVRAITCRLRVRWSPSIRL